MATQQNDPVTKGTTNGLDKGKGAPPTLLSQAKSVAGEAYSTVADKATTTIEERKSGLTNELTKAAQTVRRLSETLTDEADQTSVTEYATKYTDAAAQKLESVAEYFERSDLRTVVRDVESYGKRNPAVFLGVAFGIGILAARLFKSSPQSSAGAGARAESTRGSAALPAAGNNMNASGAN